MADVSRTRRIGEQLKQEIALKIRTEVRDSRASMISVTVVDVVRDLSQAKVLVTYLGPVEHRPEIMEALKNSAGQIRTALGKTLRLRTIPKLYFSYDEQLEKSTALSALINQAVAKDAEIAKARGFELVDDEDENVNVNVNVNDKAASKKSIDETAE